jgi:hypothetical protein
MEGLLGYSVGRGGDVREVGGERVIQIGVGGMMVVIVKVKELVGG